MNLTPRLLSASLALVLSGCATVSPLTTPYSADDAPERSSDTAVFISIEQQHSSDQRLSKRVLSTIQKIDGRDVRCDWSAGCPVWARVGAGHHTFTVRYRADFSYSGGRWLEGTLEVDVQDMKPRHVYRLKYFHDASSLKVWARAEDLGENSTQGIWFPLLGVPNAKYFPAVF